MFWKNLVLRFVYGGRLQVHLPLKLDSDLELFGQLGQNIDTNIDVSLIRISEPRFGCKGVTRCFFPMLYLTS